MTPGARPADLSLRDHKPHSTKTMREQILYRCCFICVCLWAGWDIVKCYFACYVITRPCLWIVFLCQWKHLVFFYILIICYFWSKCHQGCLAYRVCVFFLASLSAMNHSFSWFVQSCWSIWEWNKYWLHSNMHTSVLVGEKQYVRRVLCLNSQYIH